MVAVLAAGTLLCGGTQSDAAAQTVQDRTVTVAILPSQTTVGDLAQVSGMAVGLMSTGIGDVPPEQTYLDISQGNRVDDVLYDHALPPLPAFADRVPGWQEIVARARSAPADIYPGLLAGLLGARDIAHPALRDAAVIAANRSGFVRRRGSRSCAQPCLDFRIAPMSATAVRALAGHLTRADLVMAVAAPTGDRGLTPIGIAGQGFHGELTSDSTRTFGYVLSTDLLPTLLRAFGTDADLSLYGTAGEPIRGEGDLDVAALDDLADRMEVIPNRRAPVVILSLVAWIVVAAAAGLIVPAQRRWALSWLALAFAYMPLILLAGAAIEPGGLAEGLLVGLGAAALAAATLALVRGWPALAIGCAITVVAYAVDVIAGSGLTKLSLLGPNPIFGARFYGIGNELEALIAVMVPVGVGAALSAYTGRGKRVSRGVAITAFAGSAVIGSLVFATGRFGADVGAAIVLPVGAAVAAASLSGGSVRIDCSPGRANQRRWALAAVITAPVLVLALVAFIDLVSGGNAHFTRSVLDSGGANDLADIAQRRLQLSAHDFAQAAGNPLFWLLIAGVAVAGFQWRRIDAWLRPAQPVRAGFLGACAAVAVGVLVNDSGATFFVLGTLALGATLAFTWAQARPDP
jgi:hypothetical protein